MPTSFVTRSSWISSLSYFTAPDGVRYLAVFTQQHTAFLFANVPAFVPGLVAAGVWKQDGARGHFSPGRAFHRYLKGRYTHQYFSTRHEINGLSNMINACESSARERARGQRNERNAAKRARRAMTPRESRIRRVQEMRVEAETAMAWS